MKIVIKNFGPINEFTYDLSKDIIVTYGDNNIGKSYAMQVVYLLLKNLTEYAKYYDGPYYYRYSALFLQNSFISNELQSVIDKFITCDSQSLVITKQMNAAILSDLSEKFVSSFVNSCKNTFGNFKGILEQKPVIELWVADYNLKIIPSKPEMLQATIYSYQTYLKRASSDFHKSRNANGRLDIYYYKNIKNTTEVIIENLVAAISDFSRKIISTVGDVYFLPASRSGIYSGMSAFSSIIAELSKNKAMLTKKIELPGISEPISDYFLMLSNIQGQKTDPYSAVYEDIETGILHGVIKFNKSRNTLVYIPSGKKYEFEMTEVSSMVSEISPIVAVLKYIIGAVPVRTRMRRGKSILFIEEPEAHLHPQNQIKLIEVFSKLHQFDIKIVMSSHSNYIFSKLNNLLLKKSISPDIYSAILLEQKRNGSVSSYMLLDEIGVDDTNFMDVTQELFNEREDLIRSWNENIED